MSDVSGFRAETAARSRRVVTPPNRFSQVINRYLGAVNYPDPYAVRPLPHPVKELPPPTPVPGLVLAGVDDSDLLVVGHRHGTTTTALGRSV